MFQVSATTASSIQGLTYCNGNLWGSIIGVGSKKLIAVIMHATKAPQKHPLHQNWNLVCLDFQSARRIMKRRNKNWNCGFGCEGGVENLQLDPKRISISPFQGAWHALTLPLKGNKRRVIYFVKHNISHTRTVLQIYFRGVTGFIVGVYHWKRRPNVFEG